MFDFGKVTMHVVGDSRGRAEWLTIFTPHEGLCHWVPSRAPSEPEKGVHIRPFLKGLAPISRHFDVARLPNKKARLVRFNHVSDGAQGLSQEVNATRETREDGGQGAANVSKARQEGLPKGSPPQRWVHRSFLVEIARKDSSGEGSEERSLSVALAALALAQDTLCPIV